MSNTVTVSLTEFYAEYPEFNTDQYKDICPVALRQSKNFISLKNCGRLKDEQRKSAIYLMTAHLSVLSLRNRSGAASGSGAAAGIVASAAVGEVNISYQQIPADDNMFDYWLATTPYGLELLAMLEMLSTIPFYVGGSLERVF